MEEIASEILKFICYFIGRFTAPLLFWKIKIDTTFEEKNPKKWSLKFTYERDGQKYFYADTVVLIGLFVLIIIIVSLVICFN